MTPVYLKKNSKIKCKVGRITSQVNDDYGILFLRKLQVLL